jgi:fructosamine-3-kinase
MIGYMYDDTQKPADGLPHWATITQVSNALGMSRNTVSNVVKRASSNGEAWVKKEEAPDGNIHYLIDTEHERFLFHAHRWKRLKALRAALSDGEAVNWSGPLPGAISAWGSETTASFPAPALLPWPDHELTDHAFGRLPRLRHWLHTQGMQIFTNRLAEEGQENPWHWRWGELHGEGYPSDEEAVVAALDSRLTQEMQRSEEAHGALAQSQPEPSAPPRRSLFARGSGA